MLNVNRARQCTKVVGYGVPSLKFGKYRKIAQRTEKKEATGTFRKDVFHSKVHRIDAILAVVLLFSLSASKRERAH